MRFLLIATLRNEGTTLLEWLCHHQRIGFTDFLIYQNDSTDGTDRALQILSDIGVIKNFENGTPPTRYQRRAYRRASLEPEYAAADYVMALDGDEFLQINTPEGDLPSLVRAVGEHDQIRINWRLFGSSGFTGVTNSLITRRFRRAEPKEVVKNRLMSVKTLFRADKFRRPGIHVPREPLVDNWTSTNGSGMSEDDFLSLGWRSSDPGMFKFAQVNHYAIRDASTFILKSLRGGSNHANRSVKMKYWRIFDQNQVVDDGLHDRANDLLQRMRALDAETGGKLLRLRRRAFRHNRLASERALRTPDAVEMMRRIKRRNRVLATQNENG